MKLGLRAFELCCRIQRVRESTPHHEIPGRTEDVIHDALLDLVDETRRELRRQFTET
jgi:hypothetical protein